MTDSQLLFILEKKYNGCQLQEISFTEAGNMIVSFFDKGGNKHEQVLNADGTLTHFAL